MNRGERESQALDYVAREEADAGLVYTTDASILSEKVKVAFEVTTVTPVRYPIAVVLRLRSDLLDVQRRFGIPMVLITHDPDDLAQCAESVVVLRDGRVARQATGVASFPDAATKRTMSERCLRIVKMSWHEIDTQAAERVASIEGSPVAVPPVALASGAT